MNRDHMSMDKKKTTENKKRSQKDFNCDYIRGLLRVVVTNDSSNELTLATAEANRLYVGNNFCKEGQNSL